MPTKQRLRNPRQSTGLVGIPQVAPSISGLPTIAYLRPNAPVRSIASIPRSANLLHVLALPERVAHVVAFRFEGFVQIAVHVG